MIVLDTAENSFFVSVTSGSSLASRILKCILKCSYSYKDVHYLE